MRSPHRVVAILLYPSISLRHEAEYGLQDSFSVLIVVAMVMLSFYNYAQLLHIYMYITK